MNHLTLVSSQQEPTMTSRQIAELVEKRHDNVMRTIESLVDGIHIGLPQLEEVPNPGAGPKMLKQYRVGKRDSFVIVAQLSPEFTARLVDRWQELESGATPVFAMPQTFADALRLAADQQDMIQQQAARLAIAAPKVAFVERYVESTSGSKGFRHVCKLLEVKEPAFRDFLKKESIMYKLGGEWVAYQQHIDAGRFETKAGTSEVSGHAYNSSLFTAKGIEWVAGEWAKFNVRGAE